MLFIGVAAISLTVAAVPKAFADLIEYALAVALIAFAATLGLEDVSLPTGSGVLLGQLQTAIERARGTPIRRSHRGVEQSEQDRGRR
jgi:hypothetical protein